MTFFQRLKNLWRLSEFRDLEIGEQPETGDIIGPLIKKKPKQKAEFLPSTRVDEIIKGKKDVNLGDILI